MGSAVRNSVLWGSVSPGSAKSSDAVSPFGLARGRCVADGCTLAAYLYERFEQEKGMMI